MSDGQKVGCKGKSQARSEPLRRARRSAWPLAVGGRIFRRWCRRHSRAEDRGGALVAVSRARYGGWRKLEIVRWVSRRALDAVGGVLATFDECPMVLPELRIWTTAEAGKWCGQQAVRIWALPEAGVEKCLCGGDYQIANCQPIARSTCTTVGFWKATGVQCRSGNRLPEALRPCVADS